MVYFSLATHSQPENYRFASQHLYIFLQKTCTSKYGCKCFGLFFWMQLNVCVWFVCCLFLFSKFTKVQSVSHSARSLRTSSILLESWLCKLLFWYNFFVVSFSFSRLICFGNSLFFLVLFCAARSHCSIYFNVCPQWRVKFGARSLTKSVKYRRLCRWASEFILLYHHVCMHLSNCIVTATRGSWTQNNWFLFIW